MAKVVAVCNRKGGVAKTSTVQQLGAFLGGHKKLKVLLIDLDPQANLTSAVGLNEEQLEDDELTMFEVFKEKKSIKEIILVRDKFHIAPSSNEFSTADASFIGAKAPYMLKNAIEQVKEFYDYIIIDTPPTLGILTVNAMTAADGVIIPYKADAITVKGVRQLNDAINEVRGFSNATLKIYGILVTMHDTVTTVSKESRINAEQAAKNLETICFKSNIRTSAAMRTIANFGVDIFEYDGKSAVAEDYAAFGNEFLKAVK